MIKVSNVSQSIHFVLNFWVIVFYLTEAWLVSSRIIHSNWHHRSFSVSHQFGRGDLNALIYYHICQLRNLMQLRTNDKDKLQTYLRLARKFTHQTVSPGNLNFLIVILSSRKHYLSINSRSCTTSPVDDTQMDISHSMRKEAFQFYTCLISFLRVKYFQLRRNLC